MEDKFAKNTVCGYCGNTMEAKYRNKKFCSDICRVYFGRENKAELLGVIRTENSVKIINPDNGFIIQELKPPKKLNLNIEELKKQFPLIPPMPIKSDFESSLDFAAAKGEWKAKYGNLNS